jgi:putative PIN family toxin of toxin-antitoxin system
MATPHIVIDTNVLVSALRSQRGASFKLLMLLGSEEFGVSVSVPLVLEYEAAAKRLLGQIPLEESDIDNVLDYMCAVGAHRQVFFLWRPFLKDVNDDMVLELAVASSADYLVSYNKKDFHGIEQFGIHVVTPKEFLQVIGAIE